MSQARVGTFRTVKSVNYLYKVCSGTNASRSYCSVSSFKPLSFVNNYSTHSSTATDERFNFRNPNEFPANVKITSVCGNYRSLTERNGGFYQDPDRVHRENSMGLQKNPSGAYGQSYYYNRDYQNKILEHSPNTLYEEGRNVHSSYRMNSGVSKEVIGGGNDQYPINNVMFQENQGNYSNMGDHGLQHQSQYNIYGSSTGNASSNQQSSGTDQYPTNNVMFQENQGNYSNMGDHSLHHQSQYNIYGSNSGNASSNQHGSGTSYQIPNGSYSGPVNSQVSSYSQPDVKSDEASKEIQLFGTIEELDFFCKDRKFNKAVEVLGLLERHNISVDMPRYLSLMNECGESKTLKEAKQVHEHLTRSVPHLNVYIHNKILEMYSKCGSMEDAYKVFDKMPQRNLTSWDTMITWLAKNGHGEDAIEMFNEFKKVGIKPDHQMFFGIFYACSVVGDMREGLLHFESMIKTYNLVPSMDHYASVVNMLGSSGYLVEALEFIEKMPFKPSVRIWEIMMNQSRVHGDLELGDRCAELVNRLDPSHLHELSKKGLLPMPPSNPENENENENENKKGKNKLSRIPDYIKSKIFEYRAGDISQPHHHKLYSQLRCLKESMKEAGYLPETRCALHDVDQESKEEALLAHSERLALSQSLLTSPPRAEIRIIKNLRVCNDCHNALKVISKLVGRRIIARDSKRFHHFEHGKCSCGDFW